MKTPQLKIAAIHKRDGNFDNPKLKGATIELAHSLNYEGRGWWSGWLKVNNMLYHFTKVKIEGLTRSRQAPFIKDIGEEDAFFSTKEQIIGRPIKSIHRIVFYGETRCGAEVEFWTPVDELFKKVLFYDILLGGLK